MNVFSRLSEIVSVNVHALLDRAENPERMLAHLLRTMEENLASARQNAALAIAAERSLGRELEQNQALAEHWQEQARKALAQGRDDLARRALAHKLDYQGLAAALESQHAAALKLSVEVKGSLRALQNRVAEARRRQFMLVARQRAAQVRLEVERALSGPASVSFTRFAQLERRLMENEDRIAAQVEALRLDDGLEDELEKMERDRLIEQELVRLREEEDKPQV
ncbi:MAG: PspA/IM30 family protein [Gemmataceae bacterium]|nr:PspA/IM30 family protein [Gemmataceae bacterium]MCI0743183.1 PspA/IM30 family protein [Gemmataceae bacterium]